MNDLVYLNGEILPSDQAKISPFDGGFTHAAGLFETMRAYHGRVMRLTDHLDRLYHSAAALQLLIPTDRTELRAAVERVLRANELIDARIRLVLTPGIVSRPGETPAAPPRHTVFITAAPVQPYPPDLYAQGMRACICPYKQSRLDPVAGHKTLAYLPRLLALKHAADLKCNEALWFNTENQLAEGSICNVFIILDRRVLTPPLDTPILPGIVRKAVLELCAANSIPAEERPIDINTLYAAQEAFLTGSILEIMPVTTIEKHTVGPGQPGPTTHRLATLYKSLVAAECTPR